MNQILRVKGEILCWGIKPNKDIKELYAFQNPYRDFKTGNVGIHVLLNNEVAVLATIIHKFDAISPYTVKRENKIWKLYRNNEFCFNINPLPMPKWYRKATSTSVPMSEVFLHEGLHYIHQEYQGCSYFAIGEECRFCGTGKKWKVGQPIEIGEVVQEAYKEDPNYQVCLGGGTRLSTDEGAIYFENCLREIRKRVPYIPVWIEMVPPDSNSHIQMLIDAGATSFGFNIEIWDDDLRKEICPGKFKVSKKRYFEAFDYVLGKLGSNKVGSCLIVGLESPESTTKGAEELAKHGVQPCLLPFKPWDGSAFEIRPPADPRLLTETSRLSSEFMLKYQIDPFENQGCLNCNSCTVDHDYYAISADKF